MYRVGCSLEGNRRGCLLPSASEMKMVPDGGTQSRCSKEAGTQTGQTVFPAKWERARSWCLVFSPLALLSAKQFILVILFYSLSNPVR